MAPYGPVSWLQNARAAGEVTLTRGRHTESVRIEEVTSPHEAAPVLKLYATRVPITRPYFSAPADAPVEAFATDVVSHPVFRVAA